jgi:hypothetical protein
MFTDEITDDANAALEAKLREFGFVRPGVMIVREGPKAEVSRSTDGATVWNIKRPENPWGYHLGSFEKYPDAAFQVVNGIRVYLAVVPQEDEKGVVIRLRNGEPTIEPLGT